MLTGNYKTRRPNSSVFKYAKSSYEYKNPKNSHNCWHTNWTFHTQRFCATSISVFWAFCTSSAAAHETKLSKYLYRTQLMSIAICSLDTFLVKMRNFTLGGKITQKLQNYFCLEGEKFELTSLLAKVTSFCVRMNERKKFFLFTQWISHVVVALKLSTH